MGSVSQSVSQSSVTGDCVDSGTLFHSSHNTYLFPVYVLFDHGFYALFGEGQRGHERGLIGFELDFRIWRELPLLALSALG